MRLKSKGNPLFLLIFLVLIIAAVFTHKYLPDYVIPLIFIIIFIIVFIRQSGKIFSVFKGVKTMNQSGQVFSDKIWKWKEGKTIFLSELWPGMSDFTQNFDYAKSPGALPIKAAEGQIEGVSYKIYRVMFLMPGFPGILQVRLTFPKAFPGRLILQRVNGPTIGRDIDLESVEFNKKVFVSTNQAKIAYQILSPDFMAWYLALPDRPIILFDHQSCFYTIVEYKPKDQAEIISVTEELAERVQHSGALS